MVLKLIAISRTLSSAGCNCMLQDKRNHLLLINDVSVLSSSSQICEIKVNCVVILEGGREVITNTYRWILYLDNLCIIDKCNTWL